MACQRCGKQKQETFSRVCQQCGAAFTACRDCGGFASSSARLSHHQCKANHPRAMRQRAAAMPLDILPASHDRQR